MSHLVSVKHGFEAAHRLPPLGGKCTSLHGHSWSVEWTFRRTKLVDPGIVVDFGSLKGKLRGWVDAYVDHGSMLGVQDDLREPLTSHGCKVFTFGAPVVAAHPEEWFAVGLDWPTVENVATLMARVAQETLEALGIAATDAPVWVDVVEVRETPVNSACWTPYGEGAAGAWRGADRTKVP